MKTPILYINGLGSGEWQRRQKWVLGNLKRHGYQIEHAHLNWLSDKRFEQHLGETLQKAEALLKSHGRLAIVGSSAGGSMAINVFGKLDSENVLAVNMCGRLAEGKLQAWDWRKLSAMAHLGTARASQSFYDSVRFCETETIPRLTEDQKQHLFVFHQFFDFVVPHQTMLIPGVPNQRTPLIGHGLGIFVAGQMVPKLLERHTV